MDKQYIFLDSSDNVNGDGSHNNVTFNLNGFKVGSRIELLHMSVPNTFYNVTTSNNAFEVSDPTPRTVTIAEGSYSLASLVTAIQTALGGTYSVAYDAITGRITISDGSAFDMDFSVNNSMWETIGFDQNATYTGATSYTGSFVPILQANELFVEMDGLGSGYYLSNKYYQFPTFVIPLDQNRDEIVFFNANTHYPQVVQCGGCTVLNEIRVRLKGRNNELMKNVGNWNIILAVK